MGRTDLKNERRYRERKRKKDERMSMEGRRPSFRGHWFYEGQARNGRRSDESASTFTEAHWTDR